MVFSPILPKHAKTREPKDEHCVLWCTYTYIYVTPYPKIYSHLALPYITWGLIRDSKIKKKESLIFKKKFFLPGKHPESQKIKEQEREIPIEKC